MILLDIHENPIVARNDCLEEVLKTYLPLWDQHGFLGTQLTMEDLPEDLKAPTAAAAVVVVEESPMTPVETVTR